ncbi:hypothetical protein [Brevundimonas sp. PAMC22021]|uniref:hypothetical protein n=1 Tax=Brevundimonas sp. PAMC22021 TaxID=2861285 RepID=UPI001C625C72|nr:hypothetical protein [Brevundimonas sp. PAMC22021]QYF86245.1 hypothetical protein KY493_10380 [Brevundimonas sp. PAMC22021]
MLEEAPADEARAALDQALLNAIRARLEAGFGERPDGDAIALRPLLAGVPATEAAAFRALRGRIEAAGALVVVCGARASLLAADRFGLNLRTVDDPDAALAAAAGGGSAVLDVDAARPWWGRMLARPELSVAAALPDDRRARPQALVVSTRTSGPTGDDRSFWVTDAAWPDSRIVQTLSQAGLAAEPLAARGGLKLFTLAGYVQADDGRLIDAPGALSGVIGAAPVF